MACATTGSAATPAQTARAVTYRTRGVLRSFGPARAYVNVAHEAIPGYMAAMTMAFEARAPSQLDGLVPGDRVSITFTAMEDGRQLIDAIAKEPVGG